MTCTHLDRIREKLGAAGVLKVHAKTKGCEECLKTGQEWVHLRLCLECGHVGCCDSSAGRHATAHFHATRHAVMRSIEPRETWGWCYLDESMLDLGWVRCLSRFRHAPASKQEAGRAAGRSDILVRHACSASRVPNPASRVPDSRISR